MMTEEMTTEEKLLSLAENYYMDLRGSFDESIDKVSSRSADHRVTKYLLSGNYLEFAIIRDFTMSGL